MVIRKQVDPNILIGPVVAMVTYLCSIFSAILPDIITQMMNRQ